MVRNIQFDGNTRSSRAEVPILLLLIALSIWLCGPSALVAQDAKPTDERIRALERERDELRKRNGVLELRLKQLQATVNQQVTDALGTSADGRVGEPPPAPHPPGEPPVTAAPVLPRSSYQVPYWRPIGPPFTRSAGIFSPLQQPVDLVSLSVAYQDALSELRRARERGESKVAKENHPSADAESAESKVRLLRSITKAMRDQLADEVDRMHKLGAIHVVPSMDVRNLETKLQILDLILTQDPGASPAATAPTGEKPRQVPAH
jgi:hypothetical protein